MSGDESREWTFQLNIAGLTLLLFASSYLGQHLAMLLPLSGMPQVLVHSLGELVLTAVAILYTLSRAYGASAAYRGRVDWLKQSPLWLYVGLGAVILNLVLLGVLIILGKLG